MAATRIVQNIPRYPISGALMTGKQMSIQACCPMFVNGGAEEIERTSYVTTDAVTALWQAELVVNDDPDVSPAGTYYTVREMPKVIWTFKVPAGDPDVPVNLFDCLVDAPTNPTPIQSFDDAILALFERPA